MKNSKNKTINKKILEQILLELWENAIFNEESYMILEKTLLKKLENNSIKNLSLDEIYYELSTIRNRNLITKDEQNILRKIVVGFWGLSVGSHAAITWIMESRADNVKIIDPDIISPTNLNRLQLGWDSIGRLKIDVVKEKLLEINPFARIIATTNTSNNYLEKIFDKDPKINVIVDAIDDMKAKINLRKFAKQRGLPLITAADVGDNIILDIERYDLHPQPDLFLGRIPNIENIDFSSLSDVERKKLIIKLIGFRSNSEKLLDSLLNIGKSLATWPQLGATATIAGGIVTTAIKKIVLKEQVESGRYYISLDKILTLNYNSSEANNKKREKINAIKTNLHI